MQDPPVGEPVAPFKDRSTRLAIFGTLAIGVGGLCALVGLLHVALIFGVGTLPGAESGRADARTYVMGAVLYVLLGGAFVWVGIGSIRKRRWVRPMMLSLAWMWLIGGITVLLLLPGLLELSLGPAAADMAMDPTLLHLVLAVMLAGGAIVGVVVPAAFIWTYNDRNLRRTCEAHDPRPDWTARCPPTVLGLSAGLGAGALLSILSVLRPAVPLFGRLVTGWPAALMLLVGGGVCFWLARETYALRMAGWWATTVSMVVLGVSTWLTLERVRPAEIMRAFGYPDDALPGGGAVFVEVASRLTAALTVFTVVYMAAIHKHFRRPQGP